MQQRAALTPQTLYQETKERKKPDFNLFNREGEEEEETPVGLTHNVAGAGVRFPKRQRHERGYRRVRWKEEEEEVEVVFFSLLSNDVINPTRRKKER